MPYRYSLARTLAPSAPSATRLCFCLLNPSTADATHDDPTIRRCIGFARAWNFASLEVVNLFALRATDPRQLKHHPDPIGPRNDAAIRRAARRASLIILGWGAHGTLHARDARVLSLLGALNPNVAVLGLTRAAQPRHPLYLPADTQPRSFILAPRVASLGAALSAKP